MMKVRIPNPIYLRHFHLSVIYDTVFHARETHVMQYLKILLIIISHYWVRLMENYASISFENLGLLRKNSFKILSLCGLRRK